MQYIVNADEMKCYDSCTIQKIGIPSLVLMERAAIELVRVIEEKIGNKSKILICAGTGNNGGDALAIGRILASENVRVTFFMPGDKRKASEETQKQMKILQNLGFSILSNFPEKEYDIVIDGLFGIGLSREITGIYKETIEKINELHENGAYIVAVDIPSGICADTGNVLGSAVRADETVTFAYAKVGHWFYPGREYCGRLSVKDIGIPKSVILDRNPSYLSLERKEIKKLLPLRNPAGNKGTFGKVLLLAGSEDMCGAAILCGKSILRAGAGMVKIITPVANREILQVALPEAMLYTYDGEPDLNQVVESICWADVLVAGPGIGKSKSSYNLLHQFLKQGGQKRLPFVIDADGLNLISGCEELKDAVLLYEKKMIIMTPHPGELIRLVGGSMEEYKAFPYARVKELADRFSCIAVGKDAVTLVAAPKEDTLYMNSTGNQGMATAGSGDVLAGLIGGLLAQKIDPYHAACVGVYLHGMAGDKAKEEKGAYGVMASDISEKFCEIMKEISLK